MKGLSRLCLCVILFMPTASLGAELPLTPLILDKIKAEIQDYETRLNGETTFEEKHDDIQGQIFGLQAIMLFYAMDVLSPSQIANLIELLDNMKVAQIQIANNSEVEANNIEQQAIIYTFNVMMFALHHHLTDELDSNHATTQTP